MPSRQAEPSVAERSALGDCYCLRRVNPFLGVVAVVRTPGGRALSLDGRHWQIQVLAHPPRGLWSRGGHEEGLKYFRFGAWSEAEGSSRVPLNPILDTGRMVEESEQLIDRIRASAASLPFPMAGELEQWLLDREGRPLALTATALSDPDLDTLSRREWSAGGRAEQPFVSATLSAEGIEVRDPSGRYRHAESLERLIAAAAGPQPATQWFRFESGEATALDQDSPAGCQERRLPREAFPRLTLRTDWPDRRARRLVAEYVSWLAPYLLALRGLPDDLRLRMERDAADYPLRVDALWRLYPRVLDPDLLKRIRIEARLRCASA